RIRRSPERHNGIADVFIECAQMAKQNVGHHGQILIQQINQFVRCQALGERGEIANVAEHHRQVLDFASGTNVLMWILLDQFDDPGRDVLRKCPADFPLLAFFMNHPKAGDGSIRGHQRRRRYHEAVPAPPVYEAVVDEPGECGQHRHGGERGLQRTRAAAPESQPNAEKENEADVDHLFVEAADEKSAMRLSAVQQIVDDVGMDLYAHVTGALLVKRRVAQVADAQRGTANQNNFVAKRIREQRPAEYVHHRVVRIGVIGASVVDQSTAILPGMQVVIAKLNALDAIRPDVRCDLLVGNAFVLPQDLQVQRREEILVLVANHEQRPANRAVGIGSDVEETIRCGGFGQFGKVGFHSSGHRPSRLNPCLAEIEIAIAGFDLQDLREGLGPYDVEIGFGLLGVGELGSFSTQKKMAENHVSRVLEGGRKLGVDIGLLLELEKFVLQVRGRGGPDFASQAGEDVKRFAAGCRGEGYVEANHTCSALFQLTHQKSVVTSRQGVGTDCLQRLVVNANDDDARIRSALAAQGKAKVERALLDVLEKQKAGTLVAADSGIGEEPQADGRHHHRNGGVGLVRKPS